MASLTLERVRRKLEAGEVLYSKNLEAYTFGVARFVLLEARKKEHHHSFVRLEDVAEAALPIALMSEDILEKYFEEPYETAWEEALRNLPAQNRKILTSYCGADRWQRKRLAMELGIELESLRVRLARIRKKQKLPPRKSQK